MRKHVLCLSLSPYHVWCDVRLWCCSETTKKIEEKNVPSVDQNGKKESRRRPCCARFFACLRREGLPRGRREGWGAGRLDDGLLFGRDLKKKGAKEGWLRKPSPSDATRGGRGAKAGSVRRLSLSPKTPRQEAERGKKGRKKKTKGKKGNIPLKNTNRLRNNPLTLAPASPPARRAR